MMNVPLGGVMTVVVIIGISRQQLTLKIQSQTMIKVICSQRPAAASQRCLDNAMAYYLPSLSP